MANRMLELLKDRKELDHKLKEVENKFNALAKATGNCPLK